MLNHIVIMGRLTRDPELRYTQSQTPVTSFRVAVDRDFADRQTGERQTDFIDCVAWRGTAEFVSRYFQRGSMIIVSGRLQIREYTDKDGNRRNAAEIVADTIHFGESRRRDDNNNGGNNYGGSNYGGGGNYGGGSNYGGGNNYGGGYNAQRQNSAPAPASDPAPAPGAFAELDDGDGELPF